MKKYRAGAFETDLTTGPLLKRIILFALPLMATGLLQLSFNAVDIIVVGRYVGFTAMGAVGSTSSLINLIVNFFLGISLGGGIAMAKCYGAKDKDYADKVLHTGMLLGIIGGVVVGFTGLFFSGKLLVLMGSPEDILPQATSYLAIYFLGSPFYLLFDFGASVLRSTGDNIRPLIYLTLAGVIHIFINLLLVIVFGFGVEGVAIASVISQGLCAFLTVITLFFNKGFIRLSIKKLKISKVQLKEILRLGIPSGIQGALFSLSNVIIQSSINSFGDISVSGSAASSSLEGFVYTLMNGVSSSCVTVIGQNYGAKQYTRIKKAFVLFLIIVTVVGAVSGGAVMLFHTHLISLYTQNTEVAAAAFQRLKVICSTYYFCGIMEVVNYSLRGMGYSLTSMLNVLVGTCIFRIVWIAVMLPIYPTLTVVYLSYPITWVLTAAVAAIMFNILLKRKIISDKKDKETSVSLQKTA